MDSKTLKNEILSEIRIQSIKRLKMDIIAFSDTNHHQQVTIDENCGVVNVALASFANGLIIEIQDAIETQNYDISKRMSRILIQVLTSIESSFNNEIISNIINVLNEMFNSFFSSIDHIFNETINSSKIITESLYKCAIGELTIEESFMFIIKSILSAIIAVGAVALEKKLYAFLSPIVSPLLAEVLSISFSILAAAFAVVASMKFIEKMKEILLLKIAQLNKASLKYKEIEEVCNTLIPQLIKDREKIMQIYNENLLYKEEIFRSSFYNFKKAINENNIDSVLKELSQINALYGEVLQFSTFEEFDEFMISDEVLKLK